MGAMLCPAYSGHSWATGACQEHHLGRSGLPRYTSVPSTSRLHCSPAVHGRQLPASSEEPRFSAYTTTWDASAFALRLAQGCEMQCSAMDMPMPTCRQGTFPRGFIAKYSLLCCCCFRRATDLSSIGRDAHLKNCTDELSLGVQHAITPRNLHVWQCLCATRGKDAPDKEYYSPGGLGHEVQIYGIL